MSGGHFNYRQYEFGYIADEIEQLILNNESTETNEWGDRTSRDYTPETIAEFTKAVLLLKQAQAYVQRIDWLVSGDDGEDTFHERLRKDLDKIQNHEQE